MSEQSNYSAHVNLEFLKKEAKALLKLCRSGDPETIARIRAKLQSLAGLDDGHVAAAIKLADVQYALAREHGYARWPNLRQAQQEFTATPDFSRPGSDGTVPDGFNPGRWCVSYTVRPKMLRSFMAANTGSVSAWLEKHKTTANLTPTRSFINGPRR
jgi:hypothetical protein